MAFRDHLLWRRGTVAAEALHALRAPRALALLDGLDAADAELAGAGDELTDALYRLVPTLDTADRALVLRLRRALHNDRPSTADLASAEAVLPGAEAAQLRRWLDVRAAREERHAAAEAALVAELRSARLALAKQLDGDLLGGVLLSGRHVHDSIVAYRDATAASGGAAPGKRHRVAEKTALGYLTRSAVKPTPFGRFTEVGAQRWDQHPGEPGPVVRRARLNRGLLAWMAAELERLPGMDAVVRVRLNSTLRITGGRVEYFQRGRDGAADGMAGERFGAAPLSPPLRLLTDILDAGPLPRADVVAALAGRTGQPPETARAFLDKLVEVGVCHTDLGIPDQEPRPAGRIAELLRGPAPELAEVFACLQRAEDEFPAAEPRRRTALLTELVEGRDGFARAVGADAAAAAGERALVFEDTGRCGPSGGWDAAAVDRVSAEFDVLSALLPIVDDSTFVRIGLYDHFTRTRSGPTPLLEYYRDFTALGSAAMSAVMTADGVAAADALRGKRVELTDRLRGLADAGPTADLGVEWATELAEGSPRSSFAARVQIGAGGAVVLNSTMTGHGVFYSRFCDLLPGADGWSLRDAVAASTHPRQMDLTAVFGLNIALRPSLTPLELLYPRAVSAAPALTLADLVVDVDRERGRLMLVSAKDGLPVELVPMSFMFPAAGPLLYRFLCAFAPIHAPKRGWWHRIQDGRTSYPRLSMGGLVLDRRSWRLPATALDLPSSAESIGDLRAIRRWQRDLGIGDGCFYSVVEAAEAGGDWIAQTKRWARKARQARLSKRNYLDFRSPLLLNAFLRQLPDDGADRVVIEEALPDTGDCPDPRRWGAEEYVVEYAAD